MSALRQTPDGDLDLSSGTIVVETEPAAEVAQRLTNRFRLVLGEWSFDTQIGVPYFERVFFADSKGTAEDLPLIRSMIFGILQDTPGVAAVETLELDFASDTRQLSVNIIVRAQSGELVSGQLGAPFVVEI